MTHEEYIETKLITKNGFLIDIEGLVLMSDYEKPVMKVAADVITKNGGDILNVGYGMGIIDNYIQLKEPKSHTIIEPNKQLYKTASQNKKLTVINSCWTDVVEQFIKDEKKFDGIYFDIMLYQQRPKASLSNFMLKLKHILKDNGIFSCFFDIPPRKENPIGVFSDEDIYDIEYVNIQLNHTEEEIKEMNFYSYGVAQNHYIPIIKYK